MTSIPRILREHFSEYAELLPVYHALRRDEECIEQDLRYWQDRLAAHLDGLLVDPQATTALLEEAFDGGEPAAVLAAIDIALRLRPAWAVDRALTWLTAGAASEDAAQAVWSLCEAGADVAHRIADIADADDRAAIAIIEVLAQRGQIDRALTESLQRLLRSESPEVREAAWRVVGDLSLPK